jgi:PAS domain S-box-containing protein
MLRLSNQEDLQVRYRAIRVQAAGQKGCIMFLSKPEKIQTAVVDVQANRAQLVQILDAMTNPVISMDAQHKFTFLNQAACLTFGTTVAEAIGKTGYDYLPKKYADLLCKKEQEVLDTGRPITVAGEGFLKTKYGESVSLLPFYDSSMKQKRLLAVINKIPESAHLTAQPDKSLQIPGKSVYLTHRHHVRVKLGIRNKKVNLRSLLKA